MTTFSGGLGSLFGGGTTPEEQQRAAIFQAGLATLAGAQQPGATFGGALLGGLQTGAGVLQQAQQNAFRSQQIKNQQDREDRQAKEETARLKIAQAEQARKDRSEAAGVATRVATGLSSSKDPLRQFQLLSQVPEVQSALTAAQIDPSTINTPEALQQAQQQLAAFGQAGAPLPGQSSVPADITTYEYYKKLSPDEQKQFLQTKRNTESYQLADFKGGKVVFNKVTGQYEIASNANEEGAGLGARQAQEGIQKKATGAKSVIDQLNLAEQLIPFATGSTPGAGYDAVVKFFGGAPDGAKAIAQLKVVQAALVGSMPRLEGPQSDADRKLYIEAAGQIGDPTVPPEIKQAAVQTIRRIQQQYADAGTAATDQPAAANAQPRPANRPPLSSFRR